MAIVELHDNRVRVTTDGDQVRFVENIIQSVKDGYDVVDEAAFFSTYKEVVLSKSSDKPVAEPEPTPEPEEVKEEVIETETKEAPEVTSEDDKASTEENPDFDQNGEDEPDAEPKAFSLEEAAKIKAKDQLDDYAKVYGYRLDARKSLKNMYIQLEGLVNAE